MITALLITAGALWLIGRNKRVSGIGAAKKRRIYKELSLAQQAGVDFTKSFEELDKDEIKALERVSHDTGYTETYYKSLQKAYNAISGIGEAYDVTDADGNTVLTWVEDPDGTQPNRARAYETDYAALREAHDIDEDRLWAQDKKARDLEALEADLAERRKRLKKAGRSSQMQLFGVGAVRVRDVLEYDLIGELRRGIGIEWISEAINKMERRREPLQRVDRELYDEIIAITEDWCIVNGIDPDTVWAVVDPEDILLEL